MTADLAAIRARLAAASMKWGHVRALVGARNASAAQRAADADLIAHAPADLAALCDEVESLRARADRGAVNGHEHQPGESIGAGWVRVGDVVDITYRVVITDVGDECDIETNDLQRTHNLHDWRARAVLVARPHEWLEAISDDDRGECDWGYCNRPAVAMRLDPEMGDWLPVCAWHVSHPAESVEVAP